MATKKVTAIKAFCIKGNIVNIGESVEVKDSLASELISSNKAINYIPVVVDQPSEIINESYMEEGEVDEIKPKRRYRNVR